MPGISAFCNSLIKNDITGNPVLRQDKVLPNCTVLALKGDLFRKVMDDDVDLGYELMKRLSQVISLRLTHTRLRITSGLGLALLGRELGLSE